MDGTVELYEHSLDPEQRSDRVLADPETARSFETELRNLVTALEAESKPDSKAEPVTEEEREQLRTLGYLD